MDTIFARSTAPGRAGIAVVRISGPRAWRVVADMTPGELPTARHLTLRKIWCDGEQVDTGMVVLFPSGRSFTGEESAELHLHGSEAVLRRVLSHLGAQDGLRPAPAGEFTRRALENDRMSLTEVEGLGALLVAETEAQRRQATRVLDGALRRRVDAWRQDVIRILAALEVTVDFADEEVPESVAASLASDVGRLSAELRTEANGVGAAQLLSRGFEVAIVGAPNAGKSTLLNKLSGRDAALTSETAGTTRDVIEVRMEIGGLLVSLLDTAGIRETTDTLEHAGVERARDRATSADLRVFIDDIPDGMVALPGDLVVMGKADLANADAGGLAVSGVTGQGVSALLEEIERVLQTRVADAGIAMTLRQEVALRKGAARLREAADLLDVAPDRVEVASELVRGGVLALDEVVGRVGVEDVLGEIFANFCIGK